MSDLIKELKTKKPVYGLSQTLKKIKSGKALSVYISSNCQAKNDILKYAKLFNVKVEELKENNMELGVICKKTYSISALCFEK